MLGLSSYSRRLTSVSPFNPCEVEIVNPRFTRRKTAQRGRMAGLGVRPQDAGALPLAAVSSPVQ